MCAWGHALHAVLFALLFAALCDALYSGGRGERAPLARGATVMSFVLRLRPLRAVSAEKVVLHALEAEKCAAGAVMCSVLLVYGTCFMYAGGRGGARGDALCATLYAGGYGGWTLFAGGAEVMRCVLYVCWRVSSGCWRCRRRCVVCCSVCWRLWRAGCVCWRSLRCWRCRR